MTITDLETEIREQPAALRRLLAAEPHTMDGLARRCREEDVHSVLLAARGTSDNAARYAQYLLGAHAGVHVGLATPSLFTRYHRPPRLDSMAVGAISQSGRSPDVVGVVAEANRQGRPTFAVTNDPASPLAVEADTVLDLHAGEERSVAATKTYTTSLAAMALLGIALEDHRGDDDAGAGVADDDGGSSAPRDVGAGGGGDNAPGHVGAGAGVVSRRAELDAVVAQVADVIETTLTQVDVPSWLVDSVALAVVGRGFNYATAFESALKIKELTGIAAEAYSSADLLHGPVAAVSWQVPAMLVAPSGVVAPDVLAVVDGLRDRGARLVIVSDDPDALDRADLPIALPAGVPEWLSPLTAIVPGQVLGLRLAQARGLDVDQPGGLNKVTETH